MSSSTGGARSWPHRLTGCPAATTAPSTPSSGSPRRTTFLGKDSTPNDSPTLYKTDRGTLLVQGYVVTDPEALAEMRIPEGETVVEVPPSLMKYLPPEGTQHGEGHS